MTPLFASLQEAVDWVELHWNEREIPIRLHEPSHEGGGLYFTHRFEKLLGSAAHHTSNVTTQRTCHHHRLNGRSTWECPDCSGTGLYETTVLAWKWPMWHAMTQLRTDDRVSHDAILTLVINGYAVADVLTMLGMDEPTMLTHLRRLRERYDYPPREKRVQGKSDAQLDAESVDTRRPLRYAVA